MQGPSSHLPIFSSANYVPLLRVTPTTLTKHLQVLAGAGLVRDVKVGRERLWEFEPTQLEEARRSLDVIAQQWDQALKKLKLAVES